MPTSTYSHIPKVVEFLHMVRPESILDVGVGNGKMGYIARDYLDIMLGERYRRSDWKVKIDGIEVFPQYVQDHQRAVYDDIHIGDAFDVIDRLECYDLIIVGDVLEHFAKDKAWTFLDKCADHCTDSLILNIPLGDRWTQPAIYGNPYEEHLSFWSYEEFEPFVSESELYDFPEIGRYGCFLIKRNGYIHYRVRTKADFLFSKGRQEEAISYMVDSLTVLSPDLISEFVLVDLMLKDRRITDAVQRLESVVEAFPDCQDAVKHLEVLRSLQ